MEEALPYLGLAVAITAISWIRAIRRGRAWRTAAERMGLAYRRSLLDQKISGVLDGHEASAESHPGDHRRAIELCALGAPPYVTIRRQGVKGALTLFTRGDCLFGEDEFDRIVFVDGPEALTFGLFDARMRDELLYLFERSRRVAVEKGEARVTLAGRLSLPAEAIEEELRRTVALAARLAERARLPLPKRLADLVEKDRSPAVRRKALALLIAHAPDEARLFLGERSPESELAGALRDDSRAVRIAAVKSLATIGSIEHVPALQEAAASDSGLASHVEDAVRAIQARSSGSPGSLALAAAGEEGALSPVARGGEVALAKGKG